MIIYALGIHSGGGKVLLDHILSSNMFEKIDFLICDSRYAVPAGLNFQINIIFIKPNLISRWLAEIKLRNISASINQTEIFCFSNMPPAFKLKGKTILFFQNALLLPDTEIKNFSFKSYLRLKYEQFWIKFFIKNIDEVWIQSKWMRDKFFSTNAPILINPFLPYLPSPKFVVKMFRFICVTGSAPHKQLLKLISVWPKKLDPSFKILIICDTYSDHLIKHINSIDNPNIEFKFNISRSELFDFYQCSEILLNTSLIESMCLPIYEAKHFGLKIATMDVLFTKEIDFINFKFFKLTEDEIIKCSEFFLNSNI